MSTNEKIKDLYINKMFSMRKIGEQVGIAAYKVKQILLEQNVQIRTRVEQNRLTNQERGKKVNHNYFDIIDSNKKAWILGFLAADGSIMSDRNGIKISLSSKDIEILHKIREEIGIEREVKSSTSNNGFDISALAWSSENQKNKLAKYGIVPNKTYKRMFLPDFEGNLSYQASFLLGYFDGDGCFKDDGTTCRIEICSYSSHILEDFALFIKGKFDIERNVYKDPNRNNYYTLTYSTKQAKKILEFLYEDNTLYLKRKYEKYIKWKNKNRI